MLPTTLTAEEAEDVGRQLANVLRRSSTFREGSSSHPPGKSATGSDDHFGLWLDFAGAALVAVGLYIPMIQRWRAARREARRTPWDHIRGW